MCARGKNDKKPEEPLWLKVDCGPRHNSTSKNIGLRNHNTLGVASGTRCKVNGQNSVRARQVKTTTTFTANLLDFSKLKKLDARLFGPSDRRAHPF